MKEDNQNLSGGTIVGLLAAVVVGAGLALATTETVFRMVQTDISRIGVVLDALQDEDNLPDIAVFGNSITMNSLDGRIVSAELPGNPTVMNFATTGQSLIEAYLLYQDIPAGIDTVVQFVNPVTISAAANFEKQKYNAFYMFGFRPDETTYENLVDIIGEPAQTELDKSGLVQRFESRWVAKQAADRLARSTMRTDLDLQRSFKDLYYPASGADRLPPASFERAIRLLYANEKNLGRKFRRADRQDQLLRLLAKRAQDKGIRFIIVLSPIHPDAYKYRDPDFYSDARAYFAQLSSETGAAIIDAIDTVPGEYFADAGHPMDEGAALVSSFVAEQLRLIN